MERISRSLRLVRQSYAVLMQDKELMILPLISGAIIIAVAVSFFFGFGLTEEGFRERRAAALVPTFLFYVVSYSVGIFFQAAVVAGATERLRGGDPTIASSLGAAWERKGSIFAWAIVAATVGTILRAIHDRAGFLGKIVVALVGAAWSLATFFIVPVLVLEKHSVHDSFKQSWATFKKTWGETVVGSAGIGLVAMLAWLTLVAIVGLMVYVGVGMAAIAFGVLAAITLALFFSALQGVYVASLYRYATEGKGTPGFDDELLAQAFVPKGH
jgi:hypothetical protein